MRTGRSLTSRSSKWWSLGRQEAGCLNERQCVTDLPVIETVAGGVAMGHHRHSHQKVAVLWVTETATGTAVSGGTLKWPLEGRCPAVIETESIRATMGMSQRQPLSSCCPANHLCHRIAVLQIVAVMATRAAMGALSRGLWSGH